ncbi:MAG: alginate export family protein [Candidatus Methylomirabilia bacterium]
MKKLMTVFLAAALSFAVAGQASATALETSGEFRVRGWMLDNYLQDKHSTEFWDQRLRVSGVWNVAENLKVNFRADILEGFWGDNKQSPVFDATVDPNTGAVSVKQTLLGTAPKDPIAFDHVNMVFTWPNSPLTFTIGRQDATWGTGLALKSDNLDRFKIAGKFGDVTVVYVYTKNQELFTLHDTGSVDDNRSHALGAVAKMGPFTGGLIGSYTINEVNAAVDVTRLLLDAYLIGKAGIVDLKGEVAYITGKDDMATGADVDARGLGLYLGAFVPAGLVTVGVEGAYIAGDDITTATKNEGAFRSDYHSPFWSVILFNNMDYPGYAGESTGPGPDLGLGNGYGAKVSVAVAPLPGLSIYGAAVYAARNEDTATAKADPLGTEIDLVITYNITPSLSLTCGGGYLVAGDFYGNVDNPWGTVAAFTAKF